MPDPSHKLLRLLGRKQGADDLLRQLLKAQAAPGGSAEGRFDGVTVRVRALSGTAARSTSDGDR